MADQAQQPINFRLLQVGVKEYAITSAGRTSDVIDDIYVSYQFTLDAPARRVAALPRFAFRHGETEVITLTVKADFDVAVEDWPRLVADDGAVTLPAYLLQHLAVITTGFARGVLHEKLQSEPEFAGVMLPIIRVVDIVKEDLTFAAVAGI